MNRLKYALKIVHEWEKYALLFAVFVAGTVYTLASLDVT
jgi:hypothetical protein